MRLFVDPGHGGTDSGCVVGEFVEKDFNLSVAEKLVAKIATDIVGVDVNVSRSTDELVPLWLRGQAGDNWGAGFVISIHADSISDERTHGPRCYINDDADAKKFALAFLTKLNRPAAYVAGDSVRSISPKWCVFDVSQGNPLTGRAYNVLRYHAQSKPLVLIECGFATNKIDRAWLLSGDGQDQIVGAIVHALSEVSNG